MAGAGRLDAWLRKTGIAQQLAEALYGPQLQLDDAHHHQEPLIIQVDALSAVSMDVELGSMLLNATEVLRLQILERLHEQGAVSSRFARVWLRPTKVPLPLLSVGDAIQQASRSISGQVGQARPGDSSSGSSGSTQHAVHLYGVVQGASTVTARPYTKVMVCSHCGTAQDALEAGACCSGGGGQQQQLQRLAACCELASLDLAGGCYEEDLSGRVMLPHQSLYIAPLSSAAGCASYGLGPEPLLVHVEEELAGSCSIGDIVEVTGHAFLHASAGAKAGAVALMQVGATNVRPLVPHLALNAQFSSCYLAQQQQEPLQFLADALAVCADQELHPTTALALLLSAASIPTAPAAPSPALQKALLAPAGGARHAGAAAAAVQGQVSVLLLQQAHSPDGVRALRAAASLLSPHSLLLLAQLEELVQPRVFSASRQLSADGEAQHVAFGSALSMANQGIAVTDLCSLPSKLVKQLMEAMGRQSGPALPKCPGIQIRSTATLWAVAPHTAINPEALDFGGASSRPTSALGLKPEHFEVIIEDASDQGLQALFAPLAAEDSAEHRALQASLQAHLARAMLQGAPQLSEGAQALLQQYYVTLRQSMVEVSQAQLLATLIRLATACARLCHRRQVLASPDAAAAVLLTDATLRARFGSGYQGLGLPCYEDAQQASLDGYLQLVHRLVVQGLRVYGWGEDEVGE